MSLKRVAEPLYEPISLDEAKAHLRVDQSAEDAYLQGLIAVARAYVETVSLHTLMPTTWEMQWDAWPAERVIDLPMAPLRSVTSITYVLRDGSTNTFNASNYLVDAWGEPGRIALKTGTSWPSGTLQDVAGVRVRWLAGYADALSGGSTAPEIAAARAAVPAVALHAIKLLIGHLFENREQVVMGAGLVPAVLPLGVNDLLNNLRYSMKRF